MARLDGYSQSLVVNLRRFKELGHDSGSGLIRSSCINCLAHLAVLCQILSQVGPAQEELYTLCDSALERLGELTQDMRAEEYTHLDLLLGVCTTSWKNLTQTADDECYAVIMEQGIRCL